jgi:transposase
MMVVELDKKFDVHANRITDWKKQLLSGAPDVFGRAHKKAEATEETIKQLHTKIGRLTMGNDFSERGLESIHGTRRKKW